MTMVIIFLNKNCKAIDLNLKSPIFIFINCVDFMTLWHSTFVPYKIEKKACVHVMSDMDKRSSCLTLVEHLRTIKQPINHTHHPSAGLSESLPDSPGLSRAHSPTQQLIMMYCADHPSWLQTSNRYFCMILMAYDCILLHRKEPWLGFGGGMEWDVGAFLVITKWSCRGFPCSGGLYA